MKKIIFILPFLWLVVSVQAQNQKPAPAVYAGLETKGCTSHNLAGFPSPVQDCDTITLKVLVDTTFALEANARFRIETVRSYFPLIQSDSINGLPINNIVDGYMQSQTYERHEVSFIEDTLLLHIVNMPASTNRSVAISYCGNNGIWSNFSDGITVENYYKILPHCWSPAPCGIVTDANFKIAASLSFMSYKVMIDSFDKVTNSYQFYKDSSSFHDGFVVPPSPGSISGDTSFMNFQLPNGSYRVRIRVDGTLDTLTRYFCVNTCTDSMCDTLQLSGEIPTPRKVYIGNNVLLSARVLGDTTKTYPVVARISDTAGISTNVPLTALGGGRYEANYTAAAVGSYFVDYLIDSTTISTQLFHFAVISAPCMGQEYGESNGTFFFGNMFPNGYLLHGPGQSSNHNSDSLAQVWANGNACNQFITSPGYGFVERIDTIPAANCDTAVTTAGEDYGKNMIISLGDGLFARVSNLNNILKSPGDFISPEDTIALSGFSGNHSKGTLVALQDHRGNYNQSLVVPGHIGPGAGGDSIAKQFAFGADCYNTLALQVAESLTIKGDSNTASIAGSVSLGSGAWKGEIRLVLLQMGGNFFGQKSFSSGPMKIIVPLQTAALLSGSGEVVDIGKDISVPGLQSSNWIAYLESKREGTNVWETVQSVPSKGLNNIVTLQNVATTQPIIILSDKNIYQKENIITVFPNPHHSAFTVESGKEIERIMLFDMTGKTIQSVESNTNTVEITTSFLPAGVYILQVKTSKNINSFKIIKE